jgi:hypothetical protein
MVIEVRKCDGVIVIRARKDQKSRICLKKSVEVCIVRASGYKVSNTHLIYAHESSSEQGSPLLRCHERDRRVEIWKFKINKCQWYTIKQIESILCVPIFDSERC